jgi:hypothetical protein
MKYCKKCKKDLSEHKFSKDILREDGLQFYCKDCMKKILRKKRKIRADKEYEHYSNYFSRHCNLRGFK